MESVKFEIKNVTMLCKSFSRKNPYITLHPVRELKQMVPDVCEDSGNLGKKVGPVFQSPPSLNYL